MFKAVNWLKITTKFLLKNTAHIACGIKTTLCFSEKISYFLFCQIKMDV